MTFIIIKIVLAILLTSIPFVYHYAVKPKEQQSKVWRNLLTLLLHLLRKLLRNKNMQQMRHFRTNLKHLKTFRRFYTLLVFLLLIIIQFIDLNIPENQSDTIYLNHDLAGIIPAALLTCPLMTQRYADRYLLKIKNSPLFHPLAIIPITILAMFSNYYIVSETIFIIMIASIAYPYSESIEDTTTTRHRRKRKNIIKIKTKKYERKLQTSRTQAADNGQYRSFRVHKRQ